MDLFSGAPAAVLSVWVTTESEGGSKSDKPETSRSGSEGREGISSSRASPSLIRRHIREGVSIASAMVSLSGTEGEES